MDGKHKNERSRSVVVEVWREWIAPVVVAGVIALTLAFTVDAIGRADRDPDKRPTGTRTLLPVQERGGPRFAVAIRRPGTALVVQDVRSGGIVDKTMPPLPGQRFHQVAVAPNGTYIVSSYGRERIAFQRLSLANDGHAEEFTTLPRALLGVSTAWSDMAVSADGDRLAYVTYQGARPQMNVLSLGSGAHRRWTTSLRGRIGSLSWAGNRLNFVWTPMRTPIAGAPSAGSQVRSLDTTAAAGDLRITQALMPLPTPAGAAMVSHDGKTIVAAVSDRTGPVLAAFATADGRQTKVLRRFAGSAGSARLVSDSTGEHLLVISGNGQIYADAARALHGLIGTDLLDIAW